MPVEAPRTARSRRTRAELGRAVHDEVARTGTVDVEAIAAAAGVSPATFYAHFATHDDALAAALDRALTAIVDAGIEHFDIEALLEHGLDEVVERLVSRCHRVFRDEALVMRAALARLSHQRAIRDVYRHHEARAHEHYARQIVLGQKAGLLADGAPERRATSLLVVLQGLNNPLFTAARIDRAVADDLHRAIMALLGGQS